MLAEVVEVEVVQISPEVAAKTFLVCSARTDPEMKRLKYFPKISNSR